MAKFTLLIDAGGDTTGTYYGDEPSVGDVVTVELHDENGNEIEATGRVLEVLA